MKALFILSFLLSRRALDNTKRNTIRAFTLVRANFLSILHEKTYSFYFTLSLLQNTHISSSILQDISIKYSLLSIFFIISLNHLSLYALSLSLSTHFSALLLSLYTHLSGHCSTRSPLPFLFQITKAIHLPLPPPSQNLSHHQISTTHSPWPTKSDPPPNLSRTATTHRNHHPLPQPTTSKTTHHHHHHHHHQQPPTPEIQ